MTAVLNETHMGLGSFTCSCDYYPYLALVLGEKFCHVLVEWGEEPYWFGVITDTVMGPEGITIQGRGMDWWHGKDADGAVITDKEYVAGTNKLGNSYFQFDDWLWRQQQNTLWVIDSTLQQAQLGAGATVDDVLASDEQFPCVPGQQFRSSVQAQGGATLAGRLRMRTTYTGQFAPANLILNPGFELTGGSRAWDDDGTVFSILLDAPSAYEGSRVLRASPVPQPQLFTQSGFEDAGAIWNVAPDIAFVNDGNAHSGSWAMRVGPNTRPQLVVNAGFEGGAGVGWGSASFISIINAPSLAYEGGWVMEVRPVARPQVLVNSDFAAGASGWNINADINVSNLPAQAFAGNYVMVLSPNPKPQLLTNPSFESGNAGWSFPFSTEWIAGLADTTHAYEGSSALKIGPLVRPQLYANDGFEQGAAYTMAIAGTWYADTNSHFQGSYSMTTAAGGGDHKDLLLNTTNTVFQGYWAVTPGERYSLTCKAKATDDAGNMDGQASISVKTFFNNGIGAGWIVSNTVLAWGTDWQDLQVDFEVPDDIFGLQAHIAVDDHTQGWWSFDLPRITKISENVSEAYTNNYTILPNQQYTFSAMLKSGLDMKDGSIQLRVETWGPSVPTKQYVSSNQGSTKRKGSSARDWVKLDSGFRADTGYDQARLFIVAQDVFGDSFWADLVELRKDSNNASTCIGSTVAVEPDIDYELSMLVRSGLAIKEGNVQARVRISGAGKQDVWFDTPAQSDTKNQWVWVRQRFRPDPGYTQCTPEVVSTDVWGDNFYVAAVKVTKMSGNTDEIVGNPFTVAPDQSYELSAFVRADTPVQGEVELQVKFSGPNRKNQIFTSSGRRTTDNEWAKVKLNVRPQKGYTTATVSVIAVDVFGGNFYVDSVFLEKDNNNKTETTANQSIAIQPGATYRVDAWVKSDDNVTQGGVLVGVLATGPSLPDVVIDSREEGITGNDWVQASADVRVPTGYTAIRPYVSGKDILGGYFYIDDFTVTQTSQNLAIFNGGSVAVVPERNYTWVGWLRSDNTVANGEVRLAVKLTSSGRPDVLMQSSGTGVTVGEWRQISFSFKPPSGYDSAVPQVVAVDVVGGYFYADKMELKDQDDHTLVYDRVIGPSVGALTTFTQDTVAPSGAERISWAMVGEAGGSSYTVKNAALFRTGAAIATAAAIVTDLLKDPVTGANFALVPGRIFGADTIRFDLHLLNMTARTALINLCRHGWVLPYREYRVNPDCTLDFGQDFEIFHTREEIVLARGDVRLLEEPRVENNFEDLVTDITVVGADRMSASGLVTRVEGHSSVATLPKDRFGNPVRRYRIVQDSTVAHRDIAQAYADYLLSKEGQRQSVKYTIADWRALGGADSNIAPDAAPHFAVGDWIYNEIPQAGLVDPSNERMVRGKPVYPVKKRVVARTTRMGGGKFRITVISTTGEQIVLHNVAWEDQTSADLEVGDFIPDFTSDPQGGPAWLQLLQSRSSMPR